MREKLIELLKNSPYLDVLGGLSYYEEAADHLIAHGVTINRGKEYTQVGEKLSKSADNMSADAKTLDVYIPCRSCGKLIFAGGRNECLSCRLMKLAIENIALKWVPVTERLPENEQWALCFMEDKSFGTFRVFQWNHIDWQWNDGNEWFDEKDITHWMPLPLPPEGE